MLSAVELAVRPGFTVRAVTCRDDHTGWSGPEPRCGHSVVLVRRGRFRRLAGGVAVDVDPSAGYVGMPGDEEHFAHPFGGDLCTWVSLSPALWRSVAGDAARPVRASVYVDARLELAHRRVLAASRSGDVDFALTERLLGLLSAAVRQVAPEAPDLGSPAIRPGGRAGERRLVDAARAAVTAEHPASGGLLQLAAMLGVSPYRLSRVFSRELGVSLTRYRNRVRVGRALDRLEGGAADLAGLAADLGFADQAHLCRTVRAHVGHTPAAVRRLLAARAAGTAPLKIHDTGLD